MLTPHKNVNPTNEADARRTLRTLGKMADTQAKAGTGLLNARWFGAVGDGITDDTRAIQNAIDVQVAGGEGSGVFLPPGRFLVTATLVVTGTRGFRIVGSGSDIEDDGTNLGSCLIGSGLAGIPVLDLNGSAAFTLKDFTIRGNTADRVASAFLAFAFANVDYGTMVLPQDVQAMPGIYADEFGVFQSTSYFLAILAGQGRGEVFLDYELFPVVAAVNDEVAVVRATGYSGTINWFCPAIANETNLGQLKIDDPALYAATVADIMAYALPDEVGIALSCYPSEFEDQARYIRNITERAAVWAVRGRLLTLFVAYRNSPVGPGGGDLILAADFRARVRAAFATGVRVALWHGGDDLDATSQPYWDIFLEEAEGTSAAGFGLRVRSLPGGVAGLGLIENVSVWWCDQGINFGDGGEETSAADCTLIRCSVQQCRVCFRSDHEHAVNFGLYDFSAGFCDDVFQLVGGNILVSMLTTYDAKRVVYVESAGGNIGHTTITNARLDGPTYRQVVYEVAAGAGFSHATLSDVLCLGSQPAGGARIKLRNNANCTVRGGANLCGADGVLFDLDATGGKCAILIDGACLSSDSAEVVGTITGAGKYRVRNCVDQAFNGTTFLTDYEN